jgi:hypothetical protein
VLADVAQPGEVRGADRLLEPGHVPVLRVPVRPLEGVVAVEGAVRVDVQLRRIADRDARSVEPLRIVVGAAAELHLHARDPVFDPAGQLLGEPLERVRREPAGPVHRGLVPHAAQHVDERLAEQPRAQIPQRDVHGRKGHEPKAGPADIPQQMPHFVPGTGRVPFRHVESEDCGRELVLDQPDGRVVRVRVTEADGVTGKRADDDDRGRVPFERAVRLRLVGRDRAREGLDPSDRAGTR